ncbi:hypothetical protein [Sphingomonas sp. 32-62-10]|uniref:hypothetical protein n=1 Tax=Sphingomonas sp. 32-62-10 TaxID=1970436 RepID=UPI000BCA3A03|nr:MAG: hypothetical protein B7Z43_06315 [Sphingomonas sp. 12-62-6]OYX40582.1 MAG: hypothetical protein B7Y98_00600 [Sphingomonas sp. 32-62-10]
MAKVLSLAVRVPPLLLCILFGFLGIRSMTNPDRAATFFGYAFPNTGLGLSSFVGHSVSWALTIALCLALGLIRKERSWFYPAMMLFGFFALGRIAATLFHGAPVHPERLLPELAFTGLLYLAARQTPHTSR